MKKADDGYFEYEVTKEYSKFVGKIIYTIGGHYTGRFWNGSEYICLYAIDPIIAKQLKIDVESYQSILVNCFKAGLKPGFGGKFTFFLTLEDAEKALEWIIAKEVENKLIAG